MEGSGEGNDFRTIVLGVVAFIIAIALADMIQQLFTDIFGKKDVLEGKIAFLLFVVFLSIVFVHALSKKW